MAKAVGSKRYRVTLRTEGGHSYGGFGSRNAIAYLVSLIDTLYTMKVPFKGKTTYNVGAISGGTSVNTIAQHAEMLYEFRSDEQESLAVMETHFNAAIDFDRTKGITVEVELLGGRPCSGEVDAVRHETLMERAAAAALRHAGVEMSFRSGSTDCNIPLAMGVPAVCTGCYVGGGTHTREEWVEIDSMLPGLKIAFELVLHHFKVSSKDKQAVATVLATAILFTNEPCTRCARAEYGSRAKPLQAQGSALPAGGPRYHPFGTIRPLRYACRSACRSAICSASSSPSSVSATS